MLLVAVAALVFGVIFLVAASYPNEPGKAAGRVLTAVVLFVIGVGLAIPAVVFLVRALKPAAGAEGGATIVQKIDFTGDLSLEEMRCRACGGPLSKDNITVKAGAVVVSCPYCGTSYEIEEKPKW